MSQGCMEVGAKGNAAKVSVSEIESGPDRLPGNAAGVLRNTQGAVTEISDEDYRCVWRPCHKLEEIEEPEEGQDSAM